MYCGDCKKMEQRRYFADMILLTCLVYYLLKIDQCCATSTDENQSHNMYCNRSLFMEHFCKNGIRINKTITEKLRQCKVSSCPKLELKITYASKKNDPINQYEIVSLYDQVELGESGCWGYYLEVNNSSENNKIECHDISVKTLLHLGIVSTIKRTYKLVTLPTMESSEVQVVTADSCTLEGIYHFSKEVNNNFLRKCGTEGFLSARKISSVLCARYNNSREDREWSLLHATVIKECQILLLEDISTRKTKDPTICDKNKFIKDYVITNKPINDSSLHDLTQCNKNRTCYAASLYAAMGKHFSTGDAVMWYTIVKELSHKKNKDCWGFYVQVLYGANYEHEEIRYLNFMEEKMKTFEEHFKASEKRKYIVYGIPSGARTEIRLTKVAEYCTIQTLGYMKGKMKKLGFQAKCNQSIEDDGTNMYFMSDIARMICKKYPFKDAEENERTEDRKYDVQTYFNLNLNTCVFSYSGVAISNYTSTSNSTVIVYLNKDTDAQNKLTKTSKAFIIISVVLIIILFIIVIIWLLYRHRRKKILKLYSEGHEEFINKSIRSDKIPTVMIVSQPGCDLLEAFVRDLACLLKSYGIEVKLGLLDQVEIDTDGGIACYMQRNLNLCDYILILFTENSNDGKLIYKHRPYEFALRVISGLAYYSGTASRYIPIYLTKFKKAVHLIPTFLTASTSVGYQIPKEVNKLLCRLLPMCKKQSFKTTERKSKNKFFVDRMKSAAKRITEAKHAACCIEKCMKGEVYNSVSNLSAFWPSTKYYSNETLSKIPSVSNNGYMIEQLNMRKPTLLVDDINIEFDPTNDNKTTDSSKCNRFLDLATDVSYFQSNSLVTMPIKTRISHITRVQMPEDARSENSYFINSWS